jgi:hypothetical protein
MEILLDSLKGINTEFRRLAPSDWLRINNTKLDVGIIVSRVRDAMMVYEDVAKVSFEAPQGTYLYRNVIVKLKDLKYYLGLLLIQDNIWHMEYIVTLMYRGLRPNDIVTLDDGRHCLILPPEEDFRGSLYYMLIKKDGSIGKKKMSLYSTRIVVSVER